MKIISYKNGYIIFQNENDERHRTDGPAVVGNNDYQEWYLNGKLHRADGPAVVYANGYQSWWLNGKLHCENGPAIVRADGDQVWYLNGKQISKSEHARAVAAMKRIRLTT